MRKKTKSTVGALVLLILVALHTVSAQIYTEDYSASGPQNQSNSNVKYYFDFQLGSPQMNEGGYNTVAFTPTGSYSFQSGFGIPLSVSNTETAGEYNITTHTDQGSLTLFGAKPISSFSIELESTADVTNTLSNFMLMTRDGQSITIPPIVSTNGSFVGLQFYGFAPGSIQLTATDTIVSSNGTLPSTGALTSFIGDGVPFDSVPEPTSMAILVAGILLCMALMRSPRRRNSFG